MEYRPTTEEDERPVKQCRTGGWQLERRMQYTAGGQRLKCRTATHRLAGELVEQGNRRLLLHHGI